METLRFGCNRRYEVAAKPLGCWPLSRFANPAGLETAPGGSEYRGC
jgi:hypothetical protein